MKPSKRAWAAVIAALIACGAHGAPASAHDNDGAHAATTAASRPGFPAPQAVTINGELIDPQCYFTHASRGPEHADCATMCAKGGQNLAFLHEASGTVYALVAPGHGKNPNEGLLPYVGKPVQVKGTIYRVGSNAVLRIDSVSVRKS